MLVALPQIWFNDLFSASYVSLALSLIISDLLKLKPT